MAMETVSAAGGKLELMFLQQVGNDPFTPTLERAAQTSEVASRIARFISEARATLDIAIYDFQLRDDAAAIMTDALRERANNNVVITSMMRPPIWATTPYPPLHQRIWKQTRNVQARRASCAHSPILRRSKALPAIVC
jgi:hypothetical protein